MPAEFYYNDSGVWRQMTEIHYNDSGTWRRLSEMHYNDSGTWRQVFDNDFVSLDPQAIASNRDTTSGGGTATAGYLLTTDGIAQQEVNTSFITDSTTISALAGNNWWTGKPQVGVGNSYEVRATQTATNGNGSLSGTLGAWLALSSLRQWTLTDTGINVDRIATRTILIEIRDTATMTVQDSASVNLTTTLVGP